MIVQTTPIHPPIQFFFFLETCTTTKTSQKNTIFPENKQKKAELGLDPPTHF